MCGHNTFAFINCATQLHNETFPTDSVFPHRSQTVHSRYQPRSARRLGGEAAGCCSRVDNHHPRNATPAQPLHGHRGGGDRSAAGNWLVFRFLFPSASFATAGSHERSLNNGLLSELTVALRQLKARLNFNSISTLQRSTRIISRGFGQQVGKRFN